MWDDDMISYTTTRNLRYFEFWAGAKARMDDATDEQRQAVYDRIKWYCESFGLCNGDHPSETDINDLVWFDCDDIFFPDESEDE